MVWLSKLSGIIGILNKSMDTAHKSTNTLIDRLKYPGDYLSEINALDEFERQIQERKVADIASRDLTRNADRGESYTTELSAELDRVRRALEHVSLLSFGMPAELEGPSRSAGVPAKKRESWNVGDY